VLAWHHVLSELYVIASFLQVIDAQHEEQPKFEFKARPVPDFLQVPTSVVDAPVMSAPLPSLLSTSQHGNTCVILFMLHCREFMAGSRELPSLTQPQPFQLQTERRGQVHQAKLQVWA
jgi:hypothetical protein